METTVFLGMLFFMVLSTGGLIFIWLGRAILSERRVVYLLAPVMSRVRDRHALSRWIGLSLSTQGILTLVLALIVLVSPRIGMDLLSVWVGLFVFLVVMTVFRMVHHYVN